MDAKCIAGEVGRLLATRTVAHTLSLEAGLTKSPIFPYAVRLEPPFESFDPCVTFVEARERLVIAAPAPSVWVTRRLILPVTDGVDANRAEALLAGLTGVPFPMSFECWVEHGSASFLLGTPQAAISFVDATWRAVFPDSATTDGTDPLLSLQATTLTVLCDLYSAQPYHHALRATVSPWPQFLRLCADLQHDQIAFCQVVFQPVQHDWRKNIVGILEAEKSLGQRAPHGQTAAPKKVSEPLFAAVIRFGATTPSLASSIAALTGIFTTNGMPFGYRTLDDFRTVLSQEAIVAMLQGRHSHTTGSLLTGPELARVVHPSDAAAGSIRLSLLAGLPVPERLRAHGIPLGINTSRGVPVEVCQPTDQHNKSCWLLGSSRMGKSSSLIHRCRFLAAQGHGIGILDPHRTLAFELLGALGDIDPERIVFLDFDALVPVAYNPFAHAHEEDYGRLTTDYVYSLKHLVEAAGFYRMQHLLGMAIYALFVLKQNLALLPALFAKTSAGEVLRRQVIASANNAEVVRFWQDEYRLYGPAAVAPLLNRLSALLLDDRTQRTFAQQQNRVDLADAMDTGKIVIIAPPASIDAASIVGGMLIAQAKHAAFRRSGTARAARHFYLVIDEFFRFIQSAKELQSIIDEAAKGGLSVCLANQETGQLPGELLKALYSIPNIFVYGVNLPDAKHLAHLFNGKVAPETLAAQTTGEVHARIDHDIVNYQCPLPFADANPALAARIIADSQATYHAPAQLAERESLRRQPRMIDTLSEDL